MKRRNKSGKKFALESCEKEEKTFKTEGGGGWKTPTLGTLKYDGNKSWEISQGMTTKETLRTREGRCKMSQDARRERSSNYFQLLSPAKHFSLGKVFFPSGNSIFTSKLSD